MTATAALSDGTIRNVTAEGRWLTTNPSIATVSSGGLVTIVGFGKVTVQAIYQARTASLPISATPPGTLIISGRVREPGRGGIAAVRIVEMQSGAPALSDSDGQFSIAGLSGLTTARYAFEKEGFEPAQRTFDVAAGGHTRIVLELKRGSAAREPGAVSPPPPLSTAAPVVPPASHGASPLGPILLGCAGLLLAGGGGVLVGISSSEFSTLRDSCGSGCAPDRWEKYRTSERAGDVFIGVGAAALVGAAVWWLLLQKSSGEARF